MREWKDKSMEEGEEEKRGGEEKGGFAVLSTNLKTQSKDEKLLLLH